jgi:hypothetical protein
MSQSDGSIDLAAFVAQILRAARQATSEAGLQFALDGILRQLLALYDVDYTPAINTRFAAVGLSEVSSDRPDSLFGHVILDYKFPGTLADAKRFADAKAQVNRYLDVAAGGGGAGGGPAAPGAARWAGILWDGRHIAFCKSSAGEWRWSPAHPISFASLQTLVHTYRSLKRKALTPQLLAAAFGKESPTARLLIPALCARLESPVQRTRMLFREWRRLFEQISTYELRQLPGLMRWARDLGVTTDDTSVLLFATHTYYSIVVKMHSSELLAAAHGLSSTSLADSIANAPDDALLFQQVRSIEDGELYKRYRISNFLEGDFFSWYASEESPDVARALRGLATEFLDFEPGSAMLRPEAIQDLLKEFYSSLLDEQIRHDLGEYYTPDWLAQFLLDRAGYHGELNKSLLDPTCGSGTFLVEAIPRLRQRCEQEGLDRLATLRHITAHIKGLDLNPLAVISARANYILAVADLILSLGDDIELPVYLADSINVPREKRADDDGLSVMQYDLETEVASHRLEIPTVLVRTGVLGAVLAECERSVLHGAPTTHYLSALRSDQRVAPHLSPAVEERLAKLYEAILSLEAQEWDKVWCRIIHNNFSPSGFGHFDFIVGNPPWVRWSRLPETYRRRAKEHCYHYGLVSGRGYTGGIESDISTVVTFSAADHWLRVGGTIAFLITFPVFKTPSARGFRLGQLPDGTGLLVDEIHDLTRIQVFPDASNATGIYVARKTARAADATFESIRCTRWTASPSRVDAGRSLSEVLAGTTRAEEIAAPVAGWGSPWFTGSRSVFDACHRMRGRSAYLTEAHRGTVTDAARLYWLKVLEYSPKLNRAKVRTLSDDELAKARHYRAVDGIWIEADLLYPLLRGRDCGRFSARSEGWYQLIPNAHYDAMPTEEEFRNAYPLTYDYLKPFEKDLRNRATYRRYQSHLPFYAIYCVGDYSFAPWKVVWPEQQNPQLFRASVIRADVAGPLGRKVIVPDHKLYFVSTESEGEAHYLCAVLNSPPARAWVGGFLLDKQIGTAPLEFLNIPRFDPSDATHAALAEISTEQHRARAGVADSTVGDEATEARLTALVNALTAPQPPGPRAGAVGRGRRR